MTCQFILLIGGNQAGIIILYHAEITTQNIMLGNGEISRKCVITRTSEGEARASYEHFEDKYFDSQVWFFPSVFTEKQHGYVLVLTHLLIRGHNIGSHPK